MRWRIIIFAVLIVAGAYLYFNFQKAGGGALWTNGQASWSGVQNLFGGLDTWFKAHLGVSLTQILSNALQLVIWLFIFVFKVVWSVITWFYVAVTGK